MGTCQLLILAFVMLVSLITDEIYQQHVCWKEYVSDFPTDNYKLCGACKYFFLFSMNTYPDSKDLWPLLLTWINFNPSMDKKSQAQ